MAAIKQLCLQTICVFTVLFFLFMPSKSLRAQSGLTLEGGLIGSPEILFVTSLNLLQSPGHVDSAPIFSVTISTSRTDVCRVVLRFTLFSEQFQVNVVEVETLPFDFHTGNSPKIITNVAITTSRVDPDIQLNFLNYDAQIASKLQENILRTGKLPNDRYILTVELIKTDDPGANPQPIIEIIDINNPTSLDLIGPGLPIFNNFCPDVYTTFPQFSWASNASKFILTVCQVQDGNVSPEDVMQNEPHAQLTLRRDFDFLGTPSIVYPTSGVRPLMEGQTYYWQVQAVTPTAGEGEIRLPSEIWCFRVARLDDITLRLMSSSIENMLRTLFAGTPFETLLGENGPLKGFSPTGMVKFNGKNIDMFDLFNLLKQAAEGEISINDVNIE